MAAYDVAREGWRLFRLDRMSDVRVGEWGFRRRPDADQALKDLRDPMPLAAYEHRVSLRVRCSLEEAPEFMRWGGAELREITAGLCEFTAGADDPHHAAQWLAHLPFEFTVLGDHHVREALAALARRLESAASGA